MATDRDSTADASAATAPDVEFLSGLYRKYADDLRRARDEQAVLLAERGQAMSAKLDDVEAELTYLLVREHRPRKVAEIGAFHGWSTTWLLRALRDNDPDGGGHLDTFDVIDNVVRNVPKDLGEDRWEFHHGDVREQHPQRWRAADYVFIDAAHTAKFARWYIAALFGQLRPATPVSVHDVFHGRRPLPFSEGRQVLRWLARTGTSYFTPAPAANRAGYRALLEVKKELGLDSPVRRSTDNPMLYFRFRG